MTNESGTKRRRLWVGAGVAVLAVAVVGRELIRSGAVGEDLGWLSHCYGQAGVGAVVLAVAGIGLYLLNRGYDRSAG